MDALEGTLGSEVGAGTAPGAELTAREPEARAPMAADAPSTRERGSWASKVLLGLSSAHAGVLLLSLRDAHGVELMTSRDIAGLALLAVLNALAIASLAARRTRAGWYVLLAFVFAAGVRWTGEGVEGGAGLVALLAIAAGVFCATDPSLRREHGIAG